MLQHNFGFGGYIPDILSPPAVSFAPGDDAAAMALALRQSMLAAGNCSPNPAVGCVVVKNGQILARGHTHEPGGDHAEVCALKNLIQSGHEGWPEGSSVYVTLEPCSHFGRTPPCADLFRNARDVRVVIGCKDPNPQVSGAGIERLRSFGVPIECGILESEIGFTMQPFFHAMRSAQANQSSRPFIGLKWAQSIDGKMADHRSRSQWLTGNPTQYYSHWLRQKYDALAVGFETLVRDRPRLSVRMLHPAVKPRHPVRICLDPRGKFLRLTPEEQTAILTSLESGPSAESSGQHRPWMIFCGSVETPSEHQKPFASSKSSPDAVTLPPEGNAAARIFRFPKATEIQEFIQITSRYLSSLEFEQQCGRAIQSIMIEGGPGILQHYLQAMEFDICHGLIAPLFLGESPLCMLHSQSVDLADAERLRLMQVFGSGDDLIAEWSHPAASHK